jgi:uncharacterized protein YacL
MKTRNNIKFWPMFFSWRSLIPMAAWLALILFWNDGFPLVTKVDLLWGYQVSIPQGFYIPDGLKVLLLPLTTYVVCLYIDLFKAKELSRVSSEERSDFVSNYAMATIMFALIGLVIGLIHSNFGIVTYVIFVVIFILYFLFGVGKEGSYLISQKDYELLSYQEKLNLPQAIMNTSLLID